MPVLRVIIFASGIELQRKFEWKMERNGRHGHCQLSTHDVRFPSSGPFCNAFFFLLHFLRRNYRLDTAPEGLRVFIHLNFLGDGLIRYARFKSIVAEMRGTMSCPQPVHTPSTTMEPLMKRTNVSVESTSAATHFSPFVPRPAMFQIKGLDYRH